MKVADRVIILGRALQKNYDRRGYSSDTVFDVVEGRKYWKIMMISNQESVHAFIDKKTGDVYKAASFKAPAKGVRFDLRIIAQREHVLENCDWAGGYLYQR